MEVFGNNSKKKKKELNCRIERTNKKKNKKAERHAVVGVLLSQTASAFSYDSCSFSLIRPSNSANNCSIFGAAMRVRNIQQCNTLLQISDKYSRYTRLVRSKFSQGSRGRTSASKDPSLPPSGPARTTGRKFRRTCCSQNFRKEL